MSVAVAAVPRPLPQDASMAVPASSSTASPGAGLASQASASPAARYQRVESNIGEGTYGKAGGIGFTALREIKLMQAVKHLNIINCHDVFLEEGALHIVMDFMDTDLKKVLEDKSLAVSESHVQCLAKQLLEGLGALHRQWFLHRDITPMNILLSCSSGIAKLCDFGFTRTISSDNRPMTAMCTTLWYRAPELLYGARLYGGAVDMWSSGCVIAEMFHRDAIFKGRGELDMLTRIFEKRGTPNEEVWKDVSALPSYIEFSYHPEVPMASVLPTASPLACSLVRSLLLLDPKQRPDFAQALQHEMFRRPGCEASDLPFVLRTKVA
eukprot:TRINITY_DN13196_c0_g1_i1.p1 TRINITY_DN13196_c0_g1~~TRINITY_DN13196_c0_g1_i1.p1  ORF type:complete len:324 (+),score=80.83 TRINITY_DN13196_c0_g1_i1:119-1090(+)